MPPDALLQSLRETGLDVDESDPRNPLCPDVTIGFNRSGGPEFVGPWPAFLVGVGAGGESGYYAGEVDSEISTPLTRRNCGNWGPK